ncbi:MAG: HIT domain-containing protein [Chloroflexi bacterium]|nr:HIT domain-containing protein [Chloroflexota bacterium]
MSSEHLSCVFCEIVARREPATVVYEDDEFLVFQNRLRWLPVMLLVVPKRHVTQEELWADIGKAGALALSLGKRLAPGGFRLLSNFGQDALQTVHHGHIHLLGGTHLGLYV